MSGRVNCLKKLTRRQYEMIKELSLMGAAIMLESSEGLHEEQQEALESLISMCGGAEFDEDGQCTFEYSFNEKYIEEYNEIVFWKELADKLSVRDTLADLGEKVTAFNFTEYEKRRRAYYEKYLKEFDKSGYSHKLLPY
ncbi:MAG: hypothetical protein ACRDD2_12345 [Sarcina sp.]